MLDLYINFKNSIQALMRALEISVNNAQNFNTTGYKNQSASFAQVYSEAIHSGTDITNPMHTGNAVTLGAINIDFSQGSLTLGSQLDCAIVGEGFFLLSPSTTDFSASTGTMLLTRSGKFRADRANQFLVDDNGRNVLGFEVDPTTGEPINDELVPIQTNGEVDIGFVDGGILVSDFNAAKDSEDIVPTPMYRLALSTVQNKSGLLQDSGIFHETVSSGSRLNIGFSGSNIVGEGLSGQYGAIESESLEGSNFDIAKIALEMNQLQRAFSANQGVVDNVGKVLSGLMSKILG